MKIRCFPQYFVGWRLEKRDLSKSRKSWDLMANSLGALGLFLSLFPAILGLFAGFSLEVSSGAIRQRLQEMEAQSMHLLPKSCELFKAALLQNYRMPAPH